MEDREHEYLMSVQDELDAHNDAAHEAHAMEQEERQAKEEGTSTIANRKIARIETIRRRFYLAQITSIIGSIKGSDTNHQENCLNTKISTKS